jgi:hypothetical protein
MMIESRTLVNTRLKTVHPRAYFLRAPDKAVFPYVIYDIEITDIEDGVKLLTLDIDGWDNNPDTSVLETLMESVHASFKNETFITDKMVITFYTDRRIATVEGDQQNIIRRKNIYLGRLFER